MARYVRSLRDKLRALVESDSGCALHDTLRALLRDADDMLDVEEIAELLGEATRAAARSGSNTAAGVILNMEQLSGSKWVLEVLLLLESVCRGGGWVR